MKTDEEIPVTVITSSPDSFGAYFRKIRDYRALIWVFARRDLKVKYAQTLLGIGWSIVQPLTSLLIYTVFFGVLLNWKTDGIAYPVYVLSGLIGWNYFSYIVNAGTFGVQESSGLIRKIYFPKSLIPLSKTLIALTELGISLVLLIFLLVWYGQSLSWKILLLPAVLVYNTTCALCVVFWVSSLAYKRRDILHIVPFMMYFGIWFSPVFFGSNLLPGKYAFLLDFNPMANVIEMWRWSLFDFGVFKWIWIVNFLLVCVLFLTGLYVYNRRQGDLTDFL